MKTVTFFTFLLLSLCSLAQQNEQWIDKQNLNSNGCPSKGRQTQTVPTFSSAYRPSQTLTAYSYDSVRALTELNVPNMADAYPWISPDGLRLYYTGDTLGQHRLMFTQRSNTNSYFTTPIPIILGNSNFFGFWLSHDELDLYITGGTTIYYSHRNTMASSFATPIPLTLIGIGTQSIFGPSLNATQDELFGMLYDDNALSYSIAMFSKTGIDEFTYTRTLSLPLGYVAGPGQLSKDGLAYFLGAYYANDTLSLLYQLTRTTLSDTFTVTSFEQIQNISDATQYNGQPSMSDSLNWVVFVRAVTSSWTADELYIAHREQSPIAISHPNKIQTSTDIFPNPANTDFTLTIADPENAIAEIFNIQGQLVKTIYVQTSTTNVDIHDFASGIYTLKVKGKNGIVTQKLVKY